MKIYSIIIVFFFSYSAAFPQLGEEQYEITTVLKEKFYDKNGIPLTGKGIIVGDVDSGIDIFHPMFFFADGGEFSWTDVNNDRKFTPGVDGVDINGNGKVDSDEVLRILKLKDNTWGMLPDTRSKDFNPRYDFLYLDRNNNKKRDFGPEAGFTENDPSYGEQLFIALDGNGNGKLETGEKLPALKTSKVRAVRERDGIIRRRGVDLIYTEDDSSGHGTGVAGLILGGHYGVQNIHGIAPDAEIVIASVKYDYTPRFVRNFPELLGFLRDENINILLIEDGEWMWEFMDGSSVEEEMMNSMARDGVVIVGGAGNLATGNMVIADTLPAGGKNTYEVECPSMVEGHKNDGVFLSFLWRDEDCSPSFTVESPDGRSTAPLTNGSAFIRNGNYNIFYSKDLSPKGTSMFRFGFSRADSGSVSGTWTVKVETDKQLILSGYVVDVSQSWSGTSHWNSDLITDDVSICFPSTADSCIATGAYVVNFGWFDKVGGLASYSSRGYTITGKLGIDVTAPGHSTFSTEKDLGWQIFSGTSSAAPHVVGTAALLLQYNPELTHSQVRNIIINSAKKDLFTGYLPNPRWGYGKLNIEGAIKFLINNF